MLSFLAGRNYETATGIRPHVFVIALAPSSFGKDAPRQINIELATQIGIGGQIQTKLASAAGLEDALFQHETLLLLLDEIAGLFAALGDNRNAIYRALAEFLLELFSAKAVVPRSLSMRNKNALPPPVLYPSVTFFGVAVSEMFFDSLPTRLLQDGTFNRFLVFRSTATKKEFNPEFDHQLMPEDLMETAKRIANPERTGAGNLVKYQPVKISFSKEARDRAWEINQGWIDLYNAADLLEKGIFGRGGELVEKLAMLFCISREAREISLEDTARAEAIIWQSIQEVYHAAIEDVAENQFEKDMQRLSKIIKHNSPVCWRTLLQKAHRVGSSKRIQELVENLFQRGEIDFDAPVHPDDDEDATEAQKKEKKSKGKIIRWQGQQNG